ncbi:iron-sulfur cluster co-chaperone protein HscB-like isoform X2 [Halichondria panicea]|uniref:iron-sulfur cluster co-chaperone protein HscB-like isoform X2 n=1 Tax=Halichondria panicea TaxID=6063 RepID=UPI00312B956F
MIMAAVRHTCTLRARHCSFWRLAKSCGLYSQTPLRLHSSGLSCWKCGETVPLSEGEALFFCHCPRKIIMKPTTENCFKVMNCPQSYDMDILALRKRYKHLQTELHPDKFTIKTIKEREMSAEQSSLVNKAYSTLFNPYTRGLYLLELNGHTIDEKDNTSGSDLAFLEEVMTINEELQELKESCDPIRVMSIRDLSQKKLDEFAEKLNWDFQHGSIQSAKETLAKMKYFVNINGQTKELVPLN